MTISVTTDLVDISICDATSSSGTFYRLNGTNTGNPAADTDTMVQGSGCIANKMGNASGTTDVGGHFNSTNTFSLTGTDVHLYHWRFIVTAANMAAKASKGVSIGLTNTSTTSTTTWSSTNFKLWYLDGSDTIPISNGWTCYALDPNSTPNESAGTLTLSTVKNIGFVCRQTSTVTTTLSNQFVDVIRSGTGITATTDSAADTINFLAMYNVDRLTANAWGIITQSNGIYYGAGRMNIGSISQANTCLFYSANQVLLWKDFIVTNTLYGFNLLGASGNITTFKLGDKDGSGNTSNGCTIRGQGNAVWNITCGSFTEFKAYSCSFSRIRSTILSSTSEILDSSLASCGTIEANGASITNCQFVSPTATQIKVDATAEMALITKCTFTSSGTGHAIELTVAGTYTFTNNTFNGYAAADGSTGNEAIFVNVASGSVTINISGGSGNPSVRTAGATVTKVSGTVTVNINIANALGTPIQNALVLVGANTGGYLPYRSAVTITNSGTTATVNHPAHQLITSDLVLIKQSSQQLNNGIHQITVVNPNQYTYTLSSATSAKTYTLSTNQNDVAFLSFNYAGNELILGNSTISYHYNVNDIDDISTASYSHESNSFSSQTSNTSMVKYDNTGYHVYVSDYVNKIIYQYGLSSPWDLSTATYNSKLIDISGTVTSNIADMWIDHTGTRLYVLYGSNVNQYTLSTPWEISTTTYTTTINLSSVVGTTTSSLSLSVDGTKLYVTGSVAASIVHQFTLSTPWLISSATYDSASLELTGLIDVSINRTGNNLYALYTLSTTLNPSFAYGQNLFGQLGDGTTSSRSSVVQVGTLADWKQMDGGTGFSAAIKNDGTLWTWGSNTFGQLGDGTRTNRSSPIQVGLSNDWKQTSCGDLSMMALKRDGTLWTWGKNTDGQLGDGTIAHKSSPIQVGSLTDWNYIACGYTHSFAIKTDGTLWTWGGNNAGQLGDGTRTSQSSPIQIGSLTNWKQPHGGTFFSAAIKTDGTLWTWGVNANGQLGDGTGGIGTYKSSPIQVGSLTDWKQVSCGAYHITAVKTDGTLWTCGYNSSGQLGDGTTVDKSSPIQIGSLTNWRSVGSGYYHSAAIKTDGILWNWGANSFGQLGDETTVPKSSPIQVGSLTHWKEVVGGGSHTLLTSQTSANNAALMSWGYNTAGQIGDGTVVPKSSPVQVGSLTNWKQVACGYYSSIATKIDGTIWSWGVNINGQLGDGTRTNRSSPVQIGSLNNWKNTEFGKYHVAAVKTNGTLWTWGFNINGQLGDGTVADKSSPVQIGSLTDWKQVGSLAGSAHTSAIKTDGTLWTWGSNTSGQLGDGTSGLGTYKSSPIQVGALTDWAQISCGYYYTTAIKTDGTLWSWGENIHGQLGDGTATSKSSPVQIGSLTDWAYVSCGYYHTTAVKTDGTLWTWGRNNNGQLGDGTIVPKSSPIQIGSLTNWKLVAGGGYHTAAVKTNGTLWTWGFNARGQLGDGTITSTSSPIQVGSLNNWSEVACGYSNTLSTTTSKAIQQYRLTTPWNIETALQENGDPIGNCQSTFIAVYGNTDVDGHISSSRVYTSAQPIIGWARRSTSAPFYKTAPLSGNVSTTTGADLSTTLIVDQ